MRLPRLLAGSAIVAVLAGTAACGLSTLEPKLELRDAARSFGSGSTTALRLSIPSSLADVKTFGDQADKESPSTDDPTADATDAASGDGTGGAGMSDADLEKLLGSSVDVALDRGSDAKSSRDDATRLLVRVGDRDSAELRAVGQVVYARVDVPGLEQQFPDLKDGVESVRAQLTGQGSDASAPEAVRAPATAVLDGKWVSLDDHSGSWLDQQLGKAGSGTSTGTGLADDASAKLQALAGKAFGDGVVSVKRVGSDGKLGDHLVATANQRTVYTAIRGDLPGLFTGSMAEDLQKELPAADSVPDRDLAVSFWVSGGRFTRIELDAAQFLDTPAGHLVLRADVLPDQRIAAPAGAVAIDPQAISEQTGQSLDQLFTGSHVDARTAATYVDQDIRSMADEDGVAPSVRYLPQVGQDMADVAEGLQLTVVRKRIQVVLGGQTACLKLAPTTDTDGTVTDGPC